MMTATMAYGATLTVDGNDTGCSDLIGAPYCTIQAAIGDANAGDVINVASGTYTENLVIDKTLTLRGAQAGIDGRGRVAAESVIDAGVTAGNISAIAITGSPSVVIDGFKIVGSRGAVNYQATGTLSFLYNILEANSSTAGTNKAALLFVQDASSVLIQYNDITPTPILSNGTNATRFVDVTSVSLNYNHFRNGSACSPNCGWGVGVSGAATLNASYNELSENHGGGLFFFNIASADLTSNDIHHNTVGLNVGTGVNGAIHPQPHR